MKQALQGSKDRYGEGGLLERERFDAELKYTRWAKQQAPQANFEPPARWEW